MTKMRATIMAMLAVFGFAMAPAFAEGPEVGAEAPEISASEWYNLPDGVKSLKPADLKGQIVIVEFWATWCRPCKDMMPHLVDLHNKFKSRGVVLVSLSGEDDKTVADFVKKHNMPYIVGSGAESTAREYGIEAIPASFLIDPDGKVAWKGHPSNLDFELERLLKDNPPKGKGVFAEKSAEAALKKAKKLFEQKKYTEALKAYEDLTKDYKGTKPAKDAQEQVKKIKSSSRIMEIIQTDEADRISSGWLEIARMCVAYGDKDDAVKYYKRIIKKYPHNQHATVARDELKGVEGANSGKGEDEAKDKAKDKKSDAKKDKKADKKEKKGKESEGDDEGEEDNSDD